MPDDCPRRRGTTLERTAYLLLEDGRRFDGQLIGAGQLAHGEVVFNTCMSGYQEILTDPSYTGQLVTMTYPLIGNYGVNSTDCESPDPQVSGFIVRESSRVHSSWRAEKGLDARVACLGLPDRFIEHGTQRFEGRRW